jgi:Cu-Zn family superoxide dismutase
VAGTGRFHYEITVNNLSILGQLNPILRRGVIVHAKPDDGSQPVGNAGGRIACGVIGVANPGKSNLKNPSTPAHQ